VLGTNNEYIEVISTGQQTSVQSMSGVSNVSTSSTENENLLDYLQAMDSGPSLRVGSAFA